MDDILFFIIPGVVVGIAVILFLLRYVLSSVKIEHIHKFFEDKNYDEAVSVLKKMVHKDDRDIIAHYFLGEAYYQLDNYEWALPHFKKVMSQNQFTRDVEEVKVRERLADIYLHFNKHEEAQKELLMVLKLRPDNYTYYFRVGLIFYQRFYKENAAVYFKKALEINATHSDSLFYLGEIHFENKRYSEAITHMKNCLESNSAYHKAHYYIGMIYYQSRNYLQAIQEFDKSLKDQDYRVRSMLQLGRSHIESGNVDKGIVELERAIQYITTEDKVSMALRYQLAASYERIRDIPAAIEQWETIAKVDPNYQDVKKKLADFEDLRMDDKLKDLMTAADSRFELLCQKMVEHFQLDVVEFSVGIRSTLATILANEQESEWRNVRKTKTLIKIFRVNDKISDGKIREIIEEMKEIGATKSICVTTSEYSRKAIEYAENRPIELYHKVHISKLLS